MARCIFVETHPDSSGKKIQRVFETDKLSLKIGKPEYLHIVPNACLSTCTLQSFETYMATVWLRPREFLCELILLNYKWSFP